MSTSLVHCLEPHFMAFALFRLAAAATSGTAQTFMFSLRRSLQIPAMLKGSFDKALVKSGVDKSLVRLALLKK